MALTDTVVAMAWGRRMEGPVSALHLVALFAKEGVLTGDQVRTLARALEVLREQTPYDRWSVLDPGTVSITLVRAGCVRLSSALKEAGCTESIISEWINDAGHDAAPEVRYAIA